MGVPVRLCSGIPSITAMLGRVARVLSGTSSGENAATSNGSGGVVARLSEYERDHRWKRVLSKTLFIMRNVAMRLAGEAIFGKEIYAKIFLSVKDLEHKGGPGSTTNREPPRIIDNEVVGVPLARSGNHFGMTNPDMCDHPESSMIKRGNKKEKWWTCKLCGSRWTRSELWALHGTEPEATEWIGFGKYRGEQMAVVRLADPGYCQWVLDCADKDPGQSSPQLLRFARYLILAEEADQLEEFQEQLPGDRFLDGMLVEENP